MKRTHLFSLLLMLTLTTGCAATAPLPAWQDRLARYIAEQGNGDPNVLSDTADLHSPRSLRPARITFGKLDIPGPGIWPFSRKRDANGVLLGQRKVGSHDWLFFLVGVIKRRANHTAGLEDIRLLGFTIAQKGLCWRVAEDDPQALAQYLGAMRSNDPEADSGYLSHITFPAATDVFSLAVSGDVVTATERTSGAVWKLRLQVETIVGIHEARTGS